MQEKSEFGPGIDGKLVEQIVSAILSRKNAEKIVLFGSRAKGDAKKGSDVDIAVFGKDWNDMDINLAKNIIEENIKTPVKFDLLNFYALTKNKLKKDIMEQGRIIYES